MTGPRQARRAAPSARRRPERAHPAACGAALGLAALCLLPACAVGPDFVRPEPPTETRYTRGAEPDTTLAAAGRAQRFDSGYDLPEKWWRLFGSEALDSTIDRALGASPTLQAAVANLRQSQELLRAGFGALAPQAAIQAGVSGQKTNPSAFGVDAPSKTFSLFTLSLGVSYALDPFGANRRAVEGLRARVDSSRNAVLAAYLTLTGNLANAVIARASYVAQAEATEELIALQKEIIAATQAQVQGGLTSYSALLSLQSQLADLEATLAPLRQRQAQSEHLLATLSGQAPAAFDLPDARLAALALPERLPKTLPSELVRRRPDILQAEALLHAASAEIGVATAALYPSLTLSGTLGLESSSAGRLFRARNSVWDLGASLAAPLFRGGALRAERRAAVQAFEASWAEYRQTVLSAFQQVADVLRALEHDAEALQARTRTLEAAEEAARLIRANYRAGTATYVQVLIANGQQLQARLGRIQAVADRLQDTVALFVAMGGGLEPAQEVSSPR